MVFAGTTGAYMTYLAFQFQMNKDKKEICEFEMHLEIFFCFCFNLVMMT